MPTTVNVLPGSPTTPSAPPTRFPKNKIRILLLENVHQCAIDRFHNEGFTVETAVSISEEVKLSASGRRGALARGRSGAARGRGSQPVAHQGGRP